MGKSDLSNPFSMRKNSNDQAIPSYGDNKIGDPTSLIYGDGSNLTNILLSYLELQDTPAAYTNPGDIVIINPTNDRR